MSLTKKAIEDTLIRLRAEFEHARAQFGKSLETDDYVFYANIMAKKRQEIEYFEQLNLM
jgi:hypothetical protein